MPPPWIGECWPVIAGGNERVAAALAGLTDSDWRQPANCEGWLVGDIAAHLAFGATYYCEAIAGALARDPRPLWPDGIEGAYERQRLLSRATPAEGVTVFNEAAAELDAAYAHIGPEDLDLTAWHILAPRPLWRYVAMRVYELTLHEWDIHHSLGAAAGLAREPLPILTELLLGTLLPLTFDREAAAGVNAIFAFEFGPAAIPPSSPRERTGENTLGIHNGQVTLNNSGEPDVRIRISREHFVLALSGRADWTAAAHITGNLRLGGLFRTFFKPL